MSKFVSPRRTLIAAALIQAAAVTSAGAQVGTPQDPSPSIYATAQQEAKVTPDRATINISVQTKEATAAAAASANAKKQTTVINALRSSGLTNEQISTSNYSVQPEYKYEQNQEPKLTGYMVTNTVTAEIRDVNTVGKVIDATLGAGANMISSLDFYSSNTDAARRTALSLAIAKAKADAEAAATAAGGTLGGLLELTIGGESQSPPPRPMYKTMAMAADAGSTPISPGQQTIVVSVSTRWKFVGNR